MAKAPLTPLLISLACVAAAGCGGIAAPVTGTAPAAAVYGAFSGSYANANASAAVPLIGAFPAVGSPFVADNDGDFWVLPEFSSDGTFNGEADAVFSCSCGLLPGAFPISAAAVGNPAQSISGNFSNAIANTGVGSSGTFALKAMGQSTASLNTVAGTYTGYNVGNESGAQVHLTVSPNGDFTGTWGPCNLGGSLAAPSPDTLMKVAITMAPPSNVCFGPALGWAFESAADFGGVGKLGALPGPYLYVGIYNASNGMMLELAKQ